MIEVQENDNLVKSATDPQKNTISRPTTTQTHKQESVDIDNGPAALSQGESPLSATKDGNSSATIKSKMPLSEWLGAATTFKWFTDTLPKIELIDVGWDKIRSVVLPEKPQILQFKELGQFFVPSALQEAPLVGKTLEAAKKKGAPTEGKMRSKNHVTNSSMVVADVDGLSEAVIGACFEKLIADGLTFLAYTTYSHGDPEKPDARVRIIIPLDRSVTVGEYPAVWHAFDKRYFDGKVAEKDVSGAQMYQQQGTWCCHPDRVDKAKFWSNDGGVVSVNFLLESDRSIQTEKEQLPAPKEATVQQERKNIDDNEYPPSDANKIADKCQQIGAFRDTKGAGQSEPQWFDCIGVIARCQNGEDICQELSSGYSGYNKEETAKKIAHRVKTPPTTCAQFKITNPKGCKGCKQQCHSPIALGMEPTVQEKGALAAIQGRFSLINFGSKIWVLNLNALEERNKEGLAKQFEVSNRSDGALMIKRFLKANYLQNDAAEIIEEFWISPQTKCYEGVDFNPKGTAGNYLNLWVGPTVTPKVGACEFIKAFFLEVICNGDQEACYYLLRYIAQALQRPEEKPGVMIILKGGQGTGKGTLGRILRKIWGATYLQVNNIDAVTGNFNAALERAFIVFMDEALFSGNRRASDALKSLVTEPIIPINQKYQPSRQISSYHRFIAATNAEHFKNTERDDRRDFTLRVSESRKGDHAYWTTLHHDIENGGVEALAYELQQMDLSSFNIRDKPETKELLEEKLMSLNPTERWWHECLCCGSLSESDIWPDFISTKDAIEDILKLSGGRMYRKPSGIDLKQAMAKFCPSAQSAQKKQILGRNRGFTLPSLQQARAEFETYIGDAVPWPDEVVIEESPTIVTPQVNSDNKIDSESSLPF